MTALGITALHLRKADFKFTYNFVLCDRLPDTEITFGINIHKKFSISYVWDKDKNCYIQKEGKFLMHARNCDQKATIVLLSWLLKYHLDTIGVVPIRITGQIIKEHMPYFVTDEDSTKRRDPNINIINGIHNIKWKTSVNVCVSNYTKQTH